MLSFPIDISCLKVPGGACCAQSGHMSRAMGAEPPKPCHARKPGQLHRASKFLDRRQVDCRTGRPYQHKKGLGVLIHPESPHALKRHPRAPAVQQVSRLFPVYRDHDSHSKLSSLFMLAVRGFTSSEIALEPNAIRLHFSAPGRALAWRCPCAAVAELRRSSRNAPTQF
jgi:hypothetical protein